MNCDLHFKVDQFMVKNMSGGPQFLTIQKKMDKANVLAIEISN